MGVIAAVAGAVLVAALAFVLLSGGGDDEDAATATTAGDASPEESGDDGNGGGESTTDTSPGQTPDDIPEGIGARLTEIRTEGDQYAMTVDAFDFTPIINDEDSFHLHRFWDTTAPINAV